jgi:hypothetical protein
MYGLLTRLFRDVSYDYRSGGTQPFVLTMDKPSILQLTGAQSCNGQAFYEVLYNG